MESQGNSKQFVREVTLPSGRRIEVVYFDGHEQRRHEPDEELHICGTCDCRLVYPIDWSPVGKAHWRVTLRCPNCEWVGTGVFEQEVVDRFDAELDRGTDALTAQLDRVTHENMTAEVERFIAALTADQIVPGDF
jgi:hypothetical protein